MLSLTLLHHTLPEYPALYQRLQDQRLVLEAMQHFSRELRNRQRHWQEALASRSPSRDPVSLASEARELAVHELRERLSQSDPDELMAEVKAAIPQEG